LCAELGNNNFVSKTLFLLMQMVMFEASLAPLAPLVPAYHVRKRLTPLPFRDREAFIDRIQLSLSIGAVFTCYITKPVGPLRSHPLRYRRPIGTTDYIAERG
jgi:hypothetical protein